MNITPEQYEARDARRQIMEGIDAMAKSLLTKAAAQKDDRIAPLVDRLYAALKEKPDSYFLKKLYPTGSTVDLRAFDKVWREIAATLR